MQRNLVMSVCLLSIVSTFSKAVELRATIPSIEQARESLSGANAIYKGNYSFKDYIYFPKDSAHKASYARIRVYKKSQWKHKEVVLTIKAGDREVLHKSEYETLDEAKQVIDGDFIYAFQFFRQGWEYLLDDCPIFVEDIENLPYTIEVIAKSRKKIDQLFAMVGAGEIIEKSVPLFFKSYHGL